VCTGVRSCYDEGKRVAETLMFDYHRQHGIGNSFSFFFFSYVIPSHEGMENTSVALPLNIKLNVISTLIYFSQKYALQESLTHMDHA